jgi:hypothetical protein
VLDERLDGVTARLEGPYEFLRFRVAPDRQAMSGSRVNLGSVRADTASPPTTA